jgi:hypothetical protein
MIYKTFDTWLTNSKPGDKYAYHRGFLPRDGQFTWPREVREARKAFNQGFVELVQERARGEYVYWAQRKAKRKPPSEDLLFGPAWTE